MRRIWCWCAATSLLALAAQVEAATVRERSVAVTIRADGTLREHTRLRVRIDTPDDVTSWSTYRIPLDADRTLERLAAATVSPRGERQAVAAADQDTLEYAGESVFYASRRYRLVRFRELAPGSTVEVDQVVAVAPYYPASRVLLRGEAPIERLEVTVDGGGDGWRWHLGGPHDALVVEERPGGVTVRATDLPALETPVLAPRGALQPVLWFAWGGDGSWQDVGRWYQQLIAAVARDSPAVRSRARELVAGLDDRRARLDRLVDFVQAEVRYVAVEIGISGYRPTAPEEVLARMWGDCKDKSLLLVDLLAAAGIEAFPAQILSGRDRRIDALFPSPEQFNHMIVAIPDGAEYLFVDPNQSRGTSHWLHPAVQDQEALILRPGGYVLARTPIAPRLESRRLEVEGEISPQGRLRGRATLVLGGGPAATFLEEIAGLGAVARQEEVRSLLAHLLPGAALGEIAWQEGEDAVPEVGITAALVVDELVRGQGPRRSLQLPGMRATPEPQLMAGREVPMVVPAGWVRVRWQLTVPQGWCRPPEADERVANGLGFFHQSVTHPGPARVAIDRTVELSRRWIATETLPALRELALAEHRAWRRRIRLRCEDSAARPLASVDGGGLRRRGHIP